MTWKKVAWQESISRAVSWRQSSKKWSTKSLIWSSLTNLLEQFGCALFCQGGSQSSCGGTSSESLHCWNQALKQTNMTQRLRAAIVKWVKSNSCVTNISKTQNPSKDAMADVLPLFLGLCSAAESAGVKESASPLSFSLYSQLTDAATARSQPMMVVPT